MKKNFTQTSFNFFLASIFAFSAQSFLLLPQRQEILLGRHSPNLILLGTVFLLIACYSNLAMIFSPNSKKMKRVVSPLSFFALVFLAFLYFSASLFIETILLASLSLTALLSIREKNPQENLLEKAIILANIVIGLVIFFGHNFLSISLYQRIHSLFAFLFLGAAGVGLLSLFISEKLPKKSLLKAISIPWIGWTFIFLREPEVSILLLSISTFLALLTLDLIPFHKLRLPEKQMVGKSLLLALFLSQGLLLFFFSYLLNDTNTSFSIHKNDFIFIFFFILDAIMLYSVMKLHFILYELTGKTIERKNNGFDEIPIHLPSSVEEENPISKEQVEKIKQLTAQLIVEQARAKRYTTLNDLRKKLNDQLDEPLAAQLVANTAQEYFQANIIAISLYDIETRELSILASAGEMNTRIPRGYKQSIDVGIMGRAARTRKMQIVNDTTQDKDYISLQEKKNLSEISLPLIHQGHLKGVFLIGVKEKNAFSASDIRMLEALTEELVETWERSGHNHRLTALIQSNTSLSTSLNTQAVIEEVSLIARETLEARFVFTTLFDQDGSFTRFSSMGDAPNLRDCLSRDLKTNELLQVALESQKPFRVRDLRKYKYAPSIVLDHNLLRGLIVIPIRLHGVSIGAILGFGKQGGVFFSEKDESLAKLLSTQAATAIESAWLIQELRSTTLITSALHQLSSGILKIDKIEDAAELIAETAQRLVKASVAGIVLFSPDREVQTSLEVTAKDVNFGQTVPFAFVEQALTTGESITISSGASSAHIYLPIQTSLRKYGVLWVEFTENERQTSPQTQNLKTLVIQAAIVLERVLFLIDSRQKTIELKDAFDKLENTYDQTLSALMSALDARDKETEGHSIRVGKVAYFLGKELNLSEEQLGSLQRGSLLHDIGKIGISDTILNKPGKLTDEEWEIMRQHPSIGREIVEGIPFLQDAITVVYGHHERWDGSGYPQALRGEEIPIEARIFAVADIFDALTSKRPYREEASESEALLYLKEQAGILLDPEVVAAFERLLKRGNIQSLTVPIL